MGSRSGELSLVLLVAAISAFARWWSDSPQPAPPVARVRPSPAATPLTGKCDGNCPWARRDDSVQVEPYRSSREMRKDMDHADHWLSHCLTTPVIRKGKPIGMEVRFGGSAHPLARVGLRSGDVLLSLNDRPILEQFQPIGCNRTNANPLKFQVERAGKVVVIEVYLDP